MEPRKMKPPSAGTIIAWLGIFGTLLGIIAFFFGDFRTILGLNKPPEGLSEESIVATLGAMQDTQQQAELQLTEIAVQNLSAANLSAQQTLEAQRVAIQATLDSAQATQDAFVATQNAISFATATQDSINATGTQAALDATAVAAQITPTATPEPTATPVPAPVTDYRLLTGADVRLTNQGQLEFSAQANQQIPDAPPNGLAYTWLLDTDRNPDTGLRVQDIGVDAQVAATFENGSWIGTVRSVLSDGTLGDPFLFVDIRVGGPNITATLDPVLLGLPLSFDWVARSETPGEVYGLLPQFGHNTLAP